MTLEQVIGRNPYDPSKGTISAYIRYIRYNVDGYYNASSHTLRGVVKEAIAKEEERRAGKES